MYKVEEEEERWLENWKVGMKEKVYGAEDEEEWWRKKRIKCKVENERERRKRKKGGEGNN